MKHGDNSDLLRILKPSYQSISRVEAGVMIACFLMLTVLATACAVSGEGGRAQNADHNTLNVPVSTEVRTDVETQVKTQVEAQVTAALAAFKAEITADIDTEVENSVNKFTARDVTLGGGGDSVTSWIYAVGIAGSSIFSAVFYPLIWRPLRIANEVKTKAEVSRPP